MVRRVKASSTEGAARAFQNVLADPLPPPWPLSERQRPIWDEILLRRGRDEWQAVDLRFAWELADVIGQLHEEEKRLSEEGLILESKAGPRANPRASIVLRLSRRAMWLGVYLRIHPASDAGHPHLVGGMRKTEKEARAAIAMPPPPARRSTVDARRQARLLPQ
jgi:hypothetical protein